ncbi:MAG: hypothetical protein HY744_08235 [Deltaproteobacteria bacterium]|nr:hypothetical protein [Deltaproteobacteria bacterium]
MEQRLVETPLVTPFGALALSLAAPWLLALGCTAVPADSGLAPADGGGTPCPAPLLTCAGACVDTVLDPANCGGCGTACAEGEICSAGKCVLACTGGTIACAGRCVDTALDPANCGGCGKGCAPHELCSGSKCSAECSGGLTACAGKCVDSDLDPAHCGDCNHACAPGDVCSGGKCGIACLGGTTRCGSKCVDIDLDPANCGGCAVACVAGSVCSAGQCGLVCTGGTAACGSKCVDLQLDPGNCGSCGKACAPGDVCSAGECGLGCAGGTTKCAGKCVDVELDPANCGSCGKACAPGEICSAGQCGLQCAGGTSKCGSKCLDLQGDPANCGSCGKACAQGEVCAAGQCALVCAGGMTKCGSKCVDAQLDPANCGSCGNACPQGQVCAAGACSLFCLGGTTKCGSKCIDVQLDPANCGACGKACAQGEICSAGACGIVCAGGTTKCGSKCADFTNDPANCGSCGKACAQDLACVAGVCTAACAQGKTNCGGKCVDTQSDPANCGNCGGACSDPCIAAKCCGDGKRNGAEQCDKNDFGGQDCASVLGPEWKGDLACGPSCKLDTSGCTSATVYSDLTDPGKWSFFDAATIDADARGFFGAAFDGRYVYFVPTENGAYHGLVTRYDTQSAFGSKSSWATFNAAAINPGAKGFIGAAFDARYVYFVPAYRGEWHGLVTRYDTQGAFDQNGSWQFFDIGSVNGAARGFNGAAFDGRYVYFVPINNGATYHGLVARHDTQGTFDQPGSWATFDAATVSPAAKGFSGSAFDGRYVYFVPCFNGMPHGLVTRYDTQSAFGQKSSWATFDTAGVVNAGAKGFRGAAFDGRYVYLVPNNRGSPDPHGLVTRHDTQGAFGDKGSWATFDVSMVNVGAKGFVGAAFDGRYVYFVPHDNGSYDGIVARYDTLAAFDQKGSWATFDISSVNAGAKGFDGAAFDGRYLYLVPYSNGSINHGLVARFDAKTPPSMPKGYNGSFF